MADAVLLIVMAMALILFSIQEFLDPVKRHTWSLVTRALILGVIGMYLAYLYQEMGSVGAAAPATGGYVPM
jgi:hypothetical protein